MSFLNSFIFVSDNSTNRNFKFKYQYTTKFSVVFMSAVIIGLISMLHIIISN